MTNRIAICPENYRMVSSSTSSERKPGDKKNAEWLHYSMGQTKAQSLVFVVYELRIDFTNNHFDDTDII